MLPSIVAFTSREAEESRPAGDRLISGDPRQHITNQYSDPEGRFHVGQWRSSPGVWRVRYTEHEFCHLLSGRVEIESVSGEKSQFGPGSSFVIPAGFVGVWSVLEETVKLYVIYEPAPTA